MYRSKLWTMRQYAGFGDADQSNARYRYLLSQGTTGLSVAFDLPTQMGFDSDHERAQGEVGRVGVAIDSRADMARLFKDIDLAQVSTSMTINSTAATLLALYYVEAETQGINPKVLRGTVQNDILKEYMARGTYIYPPGPSMRLITDLFAFCAKEMPKWNTISISGYHIREAGSTAVQEIALTLADGVAYVEAALSAGLDLEAFAPRLAFFFNVHNHFFEEVAKFRAARRLWAKIMRERFGAKSDRACTLRFHAQTAGSTLTAQEPDNNVVRVSYQALAAVLGGAQSLHTNGLDEALALPSERAARIALRTQQVLAHETGIADAVDPLGGSPLIESLTDELCARAESLIATLDEQGGMVAAIEAGLPQQWIQDAAYEAQLAFEQSEAVVVGVNRFTSEVESKIELQKPSPESERKQIETLQAVRQSRDATAWQRSLAALERAARGDQNLLPKIVDAVRAYATVGEIADTLRGVFGEYREG